MIRLEGIIYKAFDNYVVLRGFAPLGSLAEISQNQSLISEMLITRIKKIL